MDEHCENLRRGDWVAVVGVREEGCGWDQGGYYAPPRRLCYYGQPCRVVVLCYPFLCVDRFDGGPARRFAIDLRRWRVVVVTARYARAMLAVPKPHRSKRLRKALQAKLPGCPRCGGHNIAQLCRPGQGWFLVCKDCDWQGGAPTPA